MVEWTSFTVESPLEQFEAASFLTGDPEPLHTLRMGSEDMGCVISYCFSITVIL